jgi:hypothetical protein
MKVWKTKDKSKKTKVLTMPSPTCQRPQVLTASIRTGRQGEWGTRRKLNKKIKILSASEEPHGIRNKQPLAHIQE